MPSISNDLNNTIQARILEVVFDYRQSVCYQKRAKFRYGILATRAINKDIASNDEK